MERKREQRKVRYEEWKERDRQRARRDRWRRIGESRYNR